MAGADTVTTTSIRAAQPGQAFRTTMTVLRLLFGLHFLVNGANFFFPFFSIAPPHSPMALMVMHALVTSGLFNFAKTTEVVVGVALLSNRFVPLALVLAFPVACIIAYVDVVLIGTLFGGWVLGGGTLLLNAALLLGYLRYYRPMLTMRSAPDLA